MSEAKMDKTRRNLIIATSVVGGAAGLGVAVPFVWSMWPSERAKAAGGPVEADISALAPGELMIVEWRSKPVWIMRRTKEMIEDLKKVDGKVTDPNSSVPEQPDYAKNEYRSIKPEVLVLVGICSHLGCSPSDKFQPGAQPSLPDNWAGGFLCPCHGSTFDMAGRVYKNKPAPDNLEVPPHMYLSDTRLLIGEDKKA